MTNSEAVTRALWRRFSELVAIRAECDPSRLDAVDAQIWAHEAKMRAAGIDLEGVAYSPEPGTVGAPTNLGRLESEEIDRLRRELEDVKRQRDELAEEIDELKTT